MVARCTVLRLDARCSVHQDAAKVTARLLHHRGIWRSPVCAHQVQGLSADLGVGADLHTQSKNFRLRVPNGHHSGRLYNSP